MACNSIRGVYEARDYFGTDFGARDVGSSAKPVPNPRVTTASKPLAIAATESFGRGARVIAPWTDGRKYSAMAISGTPLATRIVFEDGQLHTVPAAQLKVVITEDLERSPDRVVKEVLEFLGLSYSLLPAGPTHDCVVGKAGIMDEAADAGKKDSAGKGLVNNKAGSFGHADGLGVPGTGRDAATKGIAIGDCTSDGLKQVDAGSKVKKYKMDPAAEQALQRFFVPYNKALVAVLGYDPGWSALENAGAA